MAEIRLSKLTKQFSIGLARLVDFLNEKGANVEMNPNAKVSDEFLPAIEEKFGEDLKLKKDSEKVTIKLKEIIEMGTKKKPAHEEDEVVEKEVVIKTNVLNSVPEPAPVELPAEPVKEPVAAPVVEPAAPLAGPKIVDKIDLSQFDKKAPKPKEEPAPAPAEEPVAQPVADPVVEQVVEEPVDEPVEVSAPTPADAPVQASEPREVKITVEKLAGPKVVDKIDLSQFDKKKKKKKRERIGKEGSQKVDVTKVEASNNVAKKDKKDKNHPGVNAQAQGGKKDKKSRRDRGGDKFKPMTEAEQEEMQKEIQKQI